jgi:DNA-directed RNA polymerase subunit beta'
MRTFHIGGTASRVVEASKHEAKSAGVVKYHNLRTVINRDGDLVATNRNGEITVADDRGRERERYPVVYGARIKVKAEQRVKPRTVLVEWDPFTNPILTEFTGRVESQDIVDHARSSTRSPVWPARSSSRTPTAACSRRS